MDVERTHIQGMSGLWELNLFGAMLFDGVPMGLILGLAIVSYWLVFWQKKEIKLRNTRIRVL